MLAFSHPTAPPRPSPKVLELEPSFAEAHLCLADVYTSSGKRELADASLAAAAELRPDMAHWVSTQRAAAGGSGDGGSGESGGEGAAGPSSKRQAGEGGAEGSAGGEVRGRREEP